MSLNADCKNALLAALKDVQAEATIRALLDQVDVTDGTATASSCLVLDANKAATGLGRLTHGAFASAADGSGLVLSSAYTAGNRVYCDDGGTPIGVAAGVSVPDIRGSITRVLITEDASAKLVRLYGVMGQIKAYSVTGDVGVWNNEQVGAVHGYMELVRVSGTASYAGYGVTACLMGTFETAGDMTIGSTHVFAGVAAISKLGATGTLTQTGKSCGLYVGIYDTTNWSDGSITPDKWGYGLFIHQDSSTRGVHVGALGSNTTSGMPIGGATAINGFYADDSGAAQTASTVWRNVDVRTYFSIDQTNASADFYSIRGQIKAATGIDFTGDASQKAAVFGYLECAGATQCGTGAFLSAVEGEIWVDGNFNNSGGGKAAGVMSRIYASTGTVGGATAAFMATKQWASTQSWPYGLYIDAATTGIYMSAVTTGIKITGANTQIFDFTGVTTSIAEDNKAYDTKAGSIKILMPSGSAAYINIYDGTPG